MSGRCTACPHAARELFGPADAGEGAIPCPQLRSPARGVCAMRQGLHRPGRPQCGHSAGGHAGGAGRRARRASRPPAPVAAGRIRARVPGARPPCTHQVHLCAAAGHGHSSLSRQPRARERADVGRRHRVHVRVTQRRVRLRQLGRRVARAGGAAPACAQAHARVRAGRRRSGRTQSRRRGAGPWWTPPTRSGAALRPRVRRWTAQGQCWRARVTRWPRPGPRPRQRWPLRRLLGLYSTLSALGAARVTTGGCATGMATGSGCCHARWSASPVAHAGAGRACAPHVSAGMLRATAHAGATVPLTAWPQVRLLLHAPPGTHALVRSAMRAARGAPAGAAWPVCRAALLGEPLWAALAAHDAAAAVDDPVRGRAVVSDVVEGVHGWRTAPRTPRQAARLPREQEAAQGRGARLHVDGRGGRAGARCAQTCVRPRRRGWRRARSWWTSSRRPASALCSPCSSPRRARAGAARGPPSARRAAERVSSACWLTSALAGPGRDVLSSGRRPSLLGCSRPCMLAGAQAISILMARADSALPAVGARRQLRERARGAAVGGGRGRGAARARRAGCGGRGRTAGRRGRRRGRRGEWRGGFRSRACMRRVHGMRVPTSQVLGTSSGHTDDGGLAGWVRGGLGLRRRMPRAAQADGTEEAAGERDGEDGDAGVEEQAGEE
jgi:hypothetical protein